jgi:hypothetical protein
MNQVVKADTIKSAAAVNKISDAFMQQIKEGKVDEAYKALSSYISIDKDKFLAVGTKASVYIGQVQKKIGLPLEVSLVKNKAVRNDFIRKMYLLKYPTAALVWELTYYQPESKKGWILIGVNYSSNIDPLFQ